VIACPSCKRRLFTSRDIFCASLDGTIRCPACGRSARLDTLSRWIISCIIALLIPALFLYGGVFYGGHFFIFCILVTMGAWRALTFITFPFLTLESAAPASFDRKHGILTLVALALTAIVLDGYMAARINAEDAKENERSASAVPNRRE
jgi:CXXC-20-CXXC protein